MQAAVITGCTGAVGLGLIDALIKQDVKVIAVVRKTSKRAERIKESDKIIKVECDLRELEKLPELVQETGIRPDVFYHFGWDGTFGDCRNDMYIQNENVRYALNAVDAAEKMGCTTFIGAGSQAEYGRFEGKLNGNVPAFPENGYGIAKLCAGQMTRIRCEQKGIKHIWTRILSVYGPYDGSGTMVMSTIDKLLKGERPSCTKGEQMWDYLYSKDVGKAFYLLGEKGVNGKIYCIGSGKARPLHDYINDIKDAVNPDAQIGFGDVPYGPRQVMYLCADTEDLVKDTGFVPDYDFKSGIRETVEWCKKETL
ncbi:MAG: NAD-dependent epimerase/dehydratase family protein [Lachnospira sp.]